MLMKVSRSLQYVFKETMDRTTGHRHGSVGCLLAIGDCSSGVLNRNLVSMSEVSGDN